MSPVFLQERAKVTLLDAFITGNSKRSENKLVIPKRYIMTSCCYFLRPTSALEYFMICMTVQFRNKNANVIGSQQQPHPNIRSTLKT